MNQSKHFNKVIKQNAICNPVNPFDLDTVWANIQAVCTTNRQSIPEETVTTLSFKNSSFAPILVSSGKIYLLNGGKVLDTNTDTIVDIEGSTDAYFSTCYAPNGCIYAAPYGGSSIIKIEPNTDTVSTLGSISGSNKWRGATITPDGIMYASPHSAGSILRIDTNNDTYSTITHSYLNGTNMFTGCVLGRNGKIYLIPRRTTRVLSLDPSTDTITSLGTISGDYRYFTGQLGPDGNIYAISSDGYVKTLKIDTSTDTISLLQANNDSKGSQGACLAHNGYIYAAQYQGSYGGQQTIKLDVFTPAFSRLNIGNTNSYYSIKIAPNGCLYVFGESNIKKVDLNCSKKFSLATLLSPYINRN